MKKRKATRRRRSSVSGLKMQPVKGLLTFATIGSGAGTALGAGQLAAKAEKGKMGILRSKQGAWFLGIGGLIGAFAIPGKGLWSQLGRGISLGAVGHSAKVLLTDEDWAGNPIVYDTIKEASAVAGLWYPGQSSAGAFNNGVGNRRVQYGRN